MILVVGATGMLGGAVVRLLRNAGHEVRALVREGAAPETVEGLRAAGCVTATGDLTAPESLAAACEGVDTVVSTASAMMRPGAGNGLEEVDRAGHIALVDAARSAGVNRFVYVSFPNLEPSFPLNDAKRAVEAHLATSGLAWTSVQAAPFAEIWFSPYPPIEFDIAGGSVNIFGSGEAASSWVSLGDVAKLTAALVDVPEAAGKALPFGGPDALSQLDVVKMVEELTGRPLTRKPIPAEMLAGMVAGAPDPVGASGAGLMLACANGLAVDSSEALELVPMERTSVAQLIQAMLG